MKVAYRLVQVLAAVATLTGSAMFAGPGASRPAEADAALSMEPSAAAEVRQFPGHSASWAHVFGSARW